MFTNNNYIKYDFINHFFKPHLHRGSKIIVRCQAGWNCFDETLLPLSDVPIVSASLLLIKRLPTTQRLTGTCAAINNNSFGGSFKQLLTDRAKLGQQVNWFRKPFPRQKWRKTQKNWQYHQRDKDEMVGSWVH